MNALSRVRRVVAGGADPAGGDGFLAENKAGLEDSFGLWKRKGVDGVAYQEKLRGEWER